MRRFLKGAMGLQLVALVILVTALLAYPSLALAGGTGNMVNWGTGQPQAGKGQVSGSGTYTAAQGWTAKGVTLSAVPTGGGQVTTVPGAAPAGGNWGPITINGLATGQYTVYAIVTFTSGNNTQYISSATVIIYVQ